MDARTRAETVVANWKTDKRSRPVHLVDYVEAAIVLAVKDEREECARVAMTYSTEYHSERANHDVKAVKTMLKQAVNAAKNIANCIRSR